MAWGKFKNLTFYWVLGSIALISACNMFQPVSPPSGDAQILSAARACWDRGDIACARDYYGRLSASSADVQAKETIYLTLDQAGLGWSVFINAFAGAAAGSFDAGSVLTSLTNRLGSSAGVALRVTLFNAYQSAAAVSNTKLKAYLRFLTATALLAELFSESAASPGHFAATDIVKSPSSCKAVDAVACITTDSCNPPTGSILSTGTKMNDTNDLDSATEAQIRGTDNKPTLFMINAVLQKFVSALSDLGGANLASGTSAFSSSLVTQSLTDFQHPLTQVWYYSTCYRYALVTFNVGGT